MTVADITEPSQTQSISIDLELLHSPQKVWRALTEPQLLAQWLLPAVDLELARGAAFTLQAPPQPGWDGLVSCQFVEIEPQRKLSYTWRVGELDTVVTFTLEPTASGTRLSLVQSGFKPEQKQNFGGARYGWKMMGGRLVDLLGRLA
jgi:uncharacterized protein YndB with AHSA1/START domain